MEWILAIVLVVGFWAVIRVLERIEQKISSPPVYPDSIELDDNPTDDSIV